ncbi:Uncharacterised protein [uncultured archaeon]|nr:Uncharacterised protein [uncultured archaeon]
MRFFLALALIAATIGTVNAADIWTNNITVSEYNMTWGYTETFTGNESILYRFYIDNELGNNDSFINAWEVLKADKEMRKKLKGLLDAEPDVKINNETVGIEVIDIDSTLSPELFGKTHSVDAIVNRYNVTYRFRESIFNASSIWFMGQANTSVNIVLPEGVDVTDTVGMSNVSKSITNYTMISGFFKDISAGRGEITLGLEKNTSVRLPEINITSPPDMDNKTEGNVTKPLTEAMTRVRDISIFVVGAVIILLIYIFKIRRK